MDYHLAPLAAFLITAVLVPIHISLFLKWGKWGEDRHKLDKPRVPEMGGIAVFVGIAAGYALLHADEAVSHASIVFASILIVFIIGVADDLVALRQRTKLALLTASGIPFLFMDGLSISLAGVTLPSGIVTGVLVVIGMAAASNLTNILEGFNGESTGLGIIAACSLAVCGYVTGREDLAIYMLPMVGALLAFLIYNKYPAKVFPGDTGTLLIGGLVAAATIVTDTAVLGAIVLAPQIAEFFLKAMVRFGGVSYGPTKVDKTGVLTPPPYRSIANTLTRRYRLTEPKLVIMIWFIGALCGGLAIGVAVVLY